MDGCVGLDVHASSCTAERAAAPTPVANVHSYVADGGDSCLPQFLGRIDSSKRGVEMTC
jgi:hypothetical protein